MKLLLCLIAVSLAAAGADKPAAKKPAAATKKTAPAAQRLTLPDGAVKAGPGTWRYTDAQGKNWLFTDTPFGLARSEDKPASATGSAERAAGGSQITATEDGDSVRFEMPTPFGTSRWQRKKTELNTFEQAAWERAKSHSAEVAKQE